MLTGFVTSGFWIPPRNGADLLNLAVPTRFTALGGSSLESVSSRFGSVDIERGLYLGLPVLLMVVLLAVQPAPLARGALPRRAARARDAARGRDGAPRRRPAARRAAVGGRGAPPLLVHVAPARFAVYASLAAAVAVALWIAVTPGRLYPRPYVLPVLAVAALLPTLWHFPTFGTEKPARPAFFARGLYETCLRPGETIAVVPRGDAVLWQAESGFRFRLAANGLQPYPREGKPPNSFDADPVVYALSWIDYARPTMSTLLAFAAIHHVDRIVALPGSGYPSRAQLRSFGSVERVGGVLVAPACGRPGLGGHDLARYVAGYRAIEGHQIGYCVGADFSLVPAGLYPSGPLAGAKRAIFVAGRGLKCPPVPAGFVRRGFATAEMNVPARTYAYFAPIGAPA